MHILGPLNLQPCQGHFPENMWTSHHTGSTNDVPGSARHEGSGSNRCVVGGFSVLGAIAVCLELQRCLQRYSCVQLGLVRQILRLQCGAKQAWALEAQGAVRCGEGVRYQFTMCVYIYMYIYIYICICMYVYIYKCIYTVCVYIDIYVYIHVLLIQKNVCI